MKKGLLYLCTAVLFLSVLLLGACGGDNGGKVPAAPTIAKVRIWITLSNNPDDPSVTTLTPEQTAQASIWARGTTEENLTFKVNLTYGDKFTTLTTDVHTEGSRQAVAIGGFAAPLEPGSYTFQAISGAFGGVIGSLEITVALSLPSAPPSTPSEAPASSTPAPSSTLSEEPDKATYQEYFSEMNFGRVPEGADSPADFEKNVTVFSPGDQIALFFNSTQEVLVRWAIYDVQAKKVIKEGGFPKPLKGSYGGWNPLDIPAGKYEYKVYAGEVLVEVFPFDVQ